MLGSSSIYALGSTGGSADAVVVSHQHTGLSVNGNRVGTAGVATSAGGLCLVQYNDTATLKTGIEGVDGTGKNMPPYEVVNYWKRVA